MSHPVISLFLAWLPDGGALVVLGDLTCLALGLGALLCQARGRSRGVLGYVTVVVAMGVALGAAGATLFERRHIERVLTGEDDAAQVNDGSGWVEQHYVFPPWEAAWLRYRGYEIAQRAAWLGLGAVPGFGFGAAALLLASEQRRRRAVLDGQRVVHLRLPALACAIAGAVSIASIAGAAALPVPVADPPDIAQAREARRLARQARERLAAGIDERACDELDAALRATRPVARDSLETDLPGWRGYAEKCAALWLSELETKRIPVEGCFRAYARRITVDLAPNRCQFERLCPDPSNACTCTGASCAKGTNWWSGCPP